MNDESSSMNDSSAYNSMNDSSGGADGGRVAGNNSCLYDDTAYSSASAPPAEDDHVVPRLPSRRVPMRAHSYHRSRRTNESGGCMDHSRRTNSSSSSSNVRMPRRHSTGKAKLLVDYATTRATHSKDANRSCHGPTMSRNVYKPEESNMSNSSSSHHQGGVMNGIDWQTVSSTLNSGSEGDDDIVAAVKTDIEASPAVEEGQSLLQQEDSKEDSILDESDQSAARKIPQRRPSCSAVLRVNLARRPSMGNKTSKDFLNEFLSDHSALSQQHIDDADVFWVSNEENGGKTKKEDFEREPVGRSKSIGSSTTKPLLKYRRRSMTMASCA